MSETKPDSGHPDERTKRKDRKKEEYDLLITGGMIFDGSGNPGVSGDVAVKRDMIAQIGHCIDKTPAKRVIDASGCAVAPGFIDPHSHTDFELLVNPRAESKIRQGITTEIGGNCGFSLFPPSNPQRNYLQKKYDVTVDWNNITEFFDILMRQGIALNYGSLIGHSDLRGAVMGAADRPPTQEELKKMKVILEGHLESGAFGLSSGLIYTPGSFANTNELIELCRVVAIHNGVYSTHMRDEGDNILDAFEEAVTIAKESKVSLQISHLKIAYPRNWPKVHAILSRISEVEKENVKILADRYPYVATSTLLSVFLPPWVKQGTTEEYLRRLQDPSIRRQVCDHIRNQEEKIVSWDKIRISSVLTEHNKHFLGKSVLAIARELQKDPGDTIMDLIVGEEDQVEMINFSLNEDTFRQIILHPLVVIGSDGWALSPYGKLAEGKPHPRSYGTFPRMLGRYVREEKIMTLGRAIQKMTSITAKKFGLTWRGWLREGFFADIVIFDPDRVTDRATWEEPHQYPEGINYVIVNGRVVIDQGRHTGLLPGRVLKKEIPLTFVY
ncbi:MAG: D-aminoacylase [Deltaproteobacteria bacterium]|nr:D-aminoacylase [Deltaproteobacteria bacterium]